MKLEIDYRETMRLRLEKIDYATRIKIGATLLITLTTLLTNLSYFRTKVFEPLNIGQDEITLSDKRFDELRKALPTRATVGYIDENTQEHEVQEPVDKTKPGWWTSAEVKKYYLTQFALAPVLVVRGTDRPLVVGNFSNGQTNSNARPQGLVPIRDFGDGVILFERKTK